MITEAHASITAVNVEVNSSHKYQYLTSLYLRRVFCFSVAYPFLFLITVI